MLQAGSRLDVVIWLKTAKLVYSSNTVKIKMKACTWLVGGEFNLYNEISNRKSNSLWPKPLQSKFHILHETTYLNVF